ncbi:MAG: nucleotidyltransferase domain-containing protein [Nitrospirae bacterium CG_4_9_14_3_um_filter_44_28]|nr:MAG: nucleotidyltransferase domain-containing protein [Nitrospirae bacterium CG_4_9_14_3_um_filter_44_28]
MNLDLEKLNAVFRNYSFIASAYLFGSQATGKTGPMSDVDIAVLLKEPRPKGRELMRQMNYLSFRIEEIFKKEVDVIEMNSQGLIFQHNVLRSGNLIYDADPLFRANYVSRLISSYCDFEPTIRFIKKFHLQGIKNRVAKI